MVIILQKLTTVKRFYRKAKMVALIYGHPVYDTLFNTLYTDAALKRTTNQYSHKSNPHAIIFTFYVRIQISQLGNLHFIWSVIINK